MTRCRAAGDAWTEAMRAGQFEEAWCVSDAILATPAPPADDTPRHLQRIWDGRSLAGRRVLVRCYHGLGDTIQFIRYLPLLKSIDAQPIVWAQPSLLPLLQTIASIDELLPLHDGEPDVDRDADVELMELPFVFRTTPETIPRRVPYLHARPAPLDRSRGPAVGLVWRTDAWMPDRSIPFPLLRPLLEAPCSWHILQAPANRPAPGILETASVIAGLDLLISIDSMPAHLAGALGTPTWTLLKADADWRWMQDRSDSPWYPTMTLFRQEQAGDWASVIDRVVRQL